MFRRQHHQLVAEVLSALNDPLLAEYECWFGGGPAIVLANDEYRESVDVDFLVSEPRSYRALRQIVRDQGLGGLAQREIRTLRPPVIDGYGMRTAVLIAGVPIKFEIVHEGRIELDVPSSEQSICGVRTLTTADQVATKLLANDDCWADTATFSRDLTDLAMMRPDAAALEAGAAKAVDAYGATVGESLSKAVERLRERPQRLDECIRALKLDASRAGAWQAIRDLAAKCAKVEALNPTAFRSNPPVQPGPSQTTGNGSDRSSKNTGIVRGKSTPGSNSGSFAARQRHEADDVRLTESRTDPRN